MSSSPGATICHDGVSIRSLCSGSSRALRGDGEMRAPCVAPCARRGEVRGKASLGDGGGIKVVGLVGVIVTGVGGGCEKDVGGGCISERGSVER
jgi:hypothetical protein